MGGALSNIQVITLDGPDGVEVVVGGAIDLVTCTTLEAHLGAAVDRSSHDVRLDLREVTFLDSTGIRVLATCQQRLAPLQRRLVITGTSAPVARVLTLSGMAQVLGVDTASADNAG